MRAVALCECIVIIAAVVVGCPACVGGREVNDWGYDILASRADIVVIGKVLSIKPATSDADKILEPGIRALLEDTVYGERFRKHLIPESTMFKVTVALKGQVNSPTISVLHFTLTEPLPKEFEGSLFLFRQGLAGSGSESGVQSQYLLFLKRHSDGLFVPVTGQFDSGFSVKQIRDLVREKWEGRYDKGAK